MEKTEIITTWTDEEVIARITQTAKGKAQWEKNLTELGGDVALALDNITLRRRLCQDPLEKDLAWQLADGRYITIEACDIGYHAMLIDENWYQTDCTNTFCAATGYPDDILLSHAAECMGGIDVVGAMPTDYVGLMAAVDDGDYCDYDHIKTRRI